LNADQIQALGEWLGAQAEGYRDTQPQVGLELYRAAQELAPSPERLLSLIQLAASIGALTPEELESLVHILKTSNSLPIKPLYKTLLDVVSLVEFNPQIQQFILACRPHLPAHIYAKALSLSSINLQWQNALEVREKLLNIALDADPENLEILGSLASIYGETHQHERALQICDRQMAVAQTQSLSAQGYALTCRLRELLNAGGAAWQEALATVDSYRQVLTALAAGEIDQTPTIKKLGANLFHLPFFLPYFRDEPAQDRPLFNQITSQIGRALCKSPPQPFVWDNSLTGSRLRVGFLSLTLRRHSVGWLARTFFNHYDREQFEFFLYYIGNPPDTLGQAWFVEKCDHYFYHNYPEPLTAKIAADQIQILIDLDSLTLTGSCVVLAQKPAPIQVTWLGWDATGMDTIDYFIADPWVLPENAQDYYQETIWRLPETYIAVDGFEIGVPDVRREDLGIDPTAVIFYTAQSGYKRHPDVVDWQLQVLKQVPNSYLCVKYIYDGEGLYEQFHTQAQVLGIDPQRLRFLPPVDSEYVHRANLQCLADVILDTYPYNGATTTLEALWLGIPLVTRVGQQFAARNSYAFLTQCGISEGIAHSAEEYVDWGVRLGTDSVLRQDIRQRLLESRRTSPLWNGKRFAQQFGSALQEMWRLYQESQG
jgi:predicted O-linked N-acetylglucosamine transferase (SPINDLY family)